MQTKVLNNVLRGKLLIDTGPGMYHNLKMSCNHTKPKVKQAR